MTTELIRFHNKTPHKQTVKIQTREVRVVRQRNRETETERDVAIPAEFVRYVVAPGEHVDVPDEHADAIHFVRCADSACRRKRCRDTSHAGRHVSHGQAPLLQREGQDYGIAPSLVPLPTRSTTKPVRLEDLGDRLKVAQVEVDDPILAAARARRGAQ